MSSPRISDLRPSKARTERGRRDEVTAQQRLPLSSRQKPRLRLRRRRALVLVSAVVLFAASGVFGVVAFVTHLSRFQIERITVTGTRDVSERLVRTYAETILYDGSPHLFSRTNIFLYPRGVITKTVATSIPRIATVSIQRDTLLAQAAHIAITERTEHARWCAASGLCYLMDDHGFVYAEASESRPEGEFEYHGGLDETRSSVGQTFLPGRLRGVEELLETLTGRGYAPHGIFIENERDYIVTLQGGTELRLTFDAETFEVVKHLESVFAAGALKGRILDMQYVNLRYGNRVYYKLKDATSTTVEE